MNMTPCLHRSLDGISLAEVLQASPQVMRAVVLLSDGINSDRCTYRSDRDLDGLIELATDKRISFYTILFGTAMFVVVSHFRD